MVRPNPHRLLLAITMVIAGAAGGWAAQAAAQDLIFADGFESGNLSAWNTPAPVLPSLRMSQSDISVNEDVGAVEFTVTVLDQNGQEIQVDWTAAGPTATAGSDYSPSSGTLTIAGGASTAAIEILITDDLLDEPNEAFTISLSNPQNATIGQPSSTVVTIVDDDLPPVMGFEESAVTVDESVGIVVLPVKLNSPSTSDISVDYVAQPVTATEGDDFVAASGSVVISDGEVTGEIQIEIIDDPDAEYEESFTVVLQNPQGAVLGNSAVVTVTIAASDLAPVTRVTYSVGPVENLIPESESATLSISSGVATIDWSEDPHELFAGQQIVYGDPAQDAYIVSCFSVEETTTCSLAAAGGGALPDATSQPIVEVTHAFPSVAAALGGADDADHLGTSDLAGSRVALDILCYGSGAADSEPVVIQGWTTHPQTPITIRASDRDQHLGLWRDDQYRLEVTQGPCVRTSVGNVVLQGLQLNCTADPAADLSAVVFEDGATAGAALLTKLLIRLDSEIGPGDRIGVDVRDVDDLDLRIENSVILDLGTGSDRHAGMVIEGEASDVVVANTTVVGGDIGISTVAGFVTAVNTLVVGSAASCFEGTFSAQSRNNAATDFTAPGPGGRVTEAGWLVGPLTGTGSDAHLNCDPIGRSEVTHTTLENGETDRLFDNDIRVGIVTVSTDSAIVQLEFAEPLEISGTRLGLGFAWGHRWSLAAADSLSDMVTPSGSYRLLVENRPVSGEELPSPQYVWDVVSFGQPEKVKVLRLEVERVDGAGQIYIGEWQLDWPSSPCDAGADLSLDPAIAVTEDVDGEPRLAPWDIGADEGAWLVPRFVRHSYEVWEKEGTAVLDVTLARPATFDVAVGYRTRRFFAVDPQDFEETVGTVVIPAGDLDAVIAVPVVDDGEPDDGEVFKVDLIHPAGESFDGDSAEVVLRDGPPPPRVFFDQRRVTAAEGGSGAVLEVRLEEAAEDDVTVHWRAEDVTALMGVDFGGAEGAALIPQGGLSAEVVVPILDDDVLTSDRLFAVRIFGATGAAVRSPSRALVTIIDDDGPAFSFSASEYVVSESVGEAVVGVRLSLPVAEPASVDIVAEDDSAVLGEDYLTSMCTVSFSAGATDGSCVIGIVDDVMDEHDETLTLALANPTGAGIGDVSAAVIVIEDDDPSPEVSFEAAASSASEGGSSATVSLVLTEPSQRSVDVEWTTVDGSAENGLDFSGGPGESHFDPGQVQALVVVPLLADFEVEGDEVFSIELTGADGATISEPSTVQVTIQDDDIAPEISIETLTPTFSEGAGSAEVVLVLSEPSNDWVEVVWFAAGGTAEDGIDYIGGYDFREIEPGGTQLTLSFPILEDTKIEDDETFFVEIDIVYGAVPIGPMTVEVTITDNDVLPEIHFTEMAVAAGESAAAVQLSLEVIPSWSADASVGIAVDGGTASAGVDFELPVSRIPVPAGHSMVDFSISLIDDTEVEPNETFSIQLVDPDGCVVIEPSAVEVTILDDDLVAVVGEPDGRVYGEGDILTMDGTGSTIPSGYGTWFAVLRNDGADPMDVVHQTTELSDTFVTSEDDASYIVRLVAAAPGTLPNSVVLRGAALPCSHPVPDVGCTSAEVVINRADLKTFPFTTSYVFPEAVLLVWGGSSTPSMELERSADGGETWMAFDEPGNQDHDGGQENYTSFPDRTVEPAQTYHYRIKWNTYSEWFYLGNSFKAPGDPVTTPVWTAPRPIPTFETVDWDCPDGASPFLCLGTVSIRLDPEPGETLAGSTIRVYLNENTFEASNGAGKKVPIIWPETFPFAGRDEPGCVERKAQPDLVVEVPEDQDSVVVDVPNAWYGANSFRFEVDDGLGGFSERALLYGIHEVLGVHHAPHKMLVPLLFGTDVTVEDFQLHGLGPVGIRSPDCVDGDWREWSIWVDNRNIYTAELHYIHATAGDVDKEIGTDEFGTWTSSMTLSDGIDHRLWISRIYTCHPGVTGHIGRSILAADGTPITTTETAQEVCGEYGPTGHDPLHVDTSLEGPHPPVLAYVPTNLFTLSDADVTNLPLRFRVTDLHHDVDINSVTVTNESMEPPAQVYGYYADDQKGGEHGDWGWFVADVPMTVPPGETTFSNQIRIQASDAAGNTVDELIPIVRDGPFVWAEIAPPDPLEAEPRQIVTFDGSASIVPYLDELGGGVARWVFFSRVYGEWMPYRDPGFAEGSAGLVQRVEMPRESALKARLIVAASLLDVPSDPWASDIQCGWNIGDGRCDAKEVIVPLANPGCVQSDTWFSVIVDSTVEDVSGERREELHFDVHAATALSPIAFRWAFYDRSDVNLEFPVGDLSHPLFTWSPENHDVDATAAELGLREGDYFLRAEARYPDDGCDEDVSEWKYGRSAVLSVRINHSFRGVAPGEIVEGAGFRVYSSTWEVGQEGFVFIDDVLGDETPPMVYSGVVEPGGSVRVLADPFDIFAKAEPWFVSLSPDEEGAGRSIWWGGLKVTSAGNEEAPLAINNEEDISCGGVGTECAHAILPGQTIRGNWHGPGDDDQFSFYAGAGTEIRLRLERADTGASPQHPDSPIPEIFIIRPDGLATAYSGPLGLDDTGTSLRQTLTLDGRHHIAVRTSKGSGDYLLTFEKLAEGGDGETAFGWTDDLVHLTTDAQQSARMRVPVLDGFGNPLSGVPVLWRQGSECGLSEFCPSGVVVELLSPYDGGAYLEHDPLPGESFLWSPDFLPEAGQKHSKQRETVTKRIADARHAEAVFGRVEIFSNAVVSVDLPKTDRAEAVAKRMQIQTSQQGSKKSTKNEEWCRHDTTCGENSRPVFRAARLDLDEGEELVEIELRILEGGEEIEFLDGREVMTDVSLTVEADAIVRQEGGGISRVPIDQKVAVTVIGGRGGAIEAGGAACESLPVFPGPFTFRIGSDAGVHFVYDEPDGRPCCWIPTEIVTANVVANASVDFGQGESVPMTINSTVAIESIPRPSDPCEVRFYPTDQPVVNTNRYHASQQSGDFVSLGYAYLTDACDNVVRGHGMDDSDDHNQPGDEFRIVIPPEPPEGGFGVWAIGNSTPDEWRYLLGLRGRTQGSATQIPDGTYTIDFEVSSQSQCSESGSISESLTVQALESVPRVTFHWDWDFDGEVSLRGPNPRYSAIAPGSTVRDASDRIAVWRVPAFDDPDPDPEFEGPFTAVPVKIYVADVSRVPFDWDGNVRETYLEPVEGVVLCTGVVEEMTDEDGGIITWQGPVRSSCDQTWTRVAEGFASSDPQLTGNTPNTWIQMGLGVGIVKAPEQTGSYVLVVEPQDESFRRDDSWRIDSTWLPDNFMKFEVGGGVYLDEEYERFGATIDVPEQRQIYVQAKLDSLEPTVILDVEYTDPENKEFQSASVTMNRVGLADEGEGESVYLSEVIDLVLDGEKVLAKGVTPLAVKTGGKLESRFGDIVIAVATIENDGPVDLDIDGDNNNGSGLPDRSSREEDLETDGYGKFVFVNHNDDDADGIPDYSDLDVSEERNFVPMVLYIDLPEIEWADISISFDFDGITALNTEPEEILDPRNQSPTGFFDYRPARREYVEGGSWRKPPIRLWMIDDPSQPRSQTNLLSPRITYAASELGFGQGDDPKRVVFHVEGVNQTGPLMSQPQSSAVRVDVSVEDENYEDSIVLTVVQPDLGLNNSSNDPFSGTGSLRPGIPDVEFEIDEYDDLVEDQKEGFVFWRAAKMIDTDVISTFRDADPPDKLVNFFPVRIEIPEVLTEMGFLAYLRIRADHNEAFEFVMNPSDPDGNILEYLQDPTMARTTRYIATELTQLISSIPCIGADRLRLDTTESTFSVLLSAMPDSLTWGLDAPDVARLRIELVLTSPGYPIDGMVADSAVVTIKKLTWENGLANNQLFWMGSSGRVLNAGFQYPIDVVGGTSAYQAISIYDGFSHQSGPTPDSGKKNFVVFVHGFNVNPDLAFESSAEFFKRLFFAGYRGNFIGLNWHGDEDDPHQHNCPELTPFDAPCVAKFEPNIVNAFQTSSALEKFLRLRVGEIWGAESSNVYLVAHSLGNQVSFDALRLSSALHPDNGPLVKHMVSVEAAVWEETFWPVEEVHYANHYYTIDELKRGSWAFWFNQAESPVSASVQRIINSYSPEDRALWLMKVGNWYASSGNNRDRRVDRAFDRGTANHFRVPVGDGLLASDPENRPDLSLEIPALIKGNVLMTYPGWNDFTSPLGTVPNPLVGTYSILAVGDLGWTEKGHSDFLAEPFSNVWPWYERLMALDENLGNESVLPRGEE